MVLTNTDPRGSFCHLITGDLILLLGGVGGAGKGEDGEEDSH